MLFSDGLSNTGLTTTEINQSLQSVPTIEGLTVNTFGFGKDHDSDMLKNIAFAANGGLYYYIESTNSIPSLFGESLVGVLSTVANNVEVEIAAYDGCRATRLITRYPTTEAVPLKVRKILQNTRKHKKYPKTQKYPIYKILRKFLEKQNIRKYPISDLFLIFFFRITK